MHVIVYDLEMTVCRKKTDISEIIEIGAVRLDHTGHDIQVIDDFQCFVKPKIQPELTISTKTFTGISADDVQNAEQLPQALTKFQQWMEGSSLFLCAWGPDDLRQLLQECQRQSIDAKWIQNHNDLQRLVTPALTKNAKQQTALTSALELLNLSFEGALHRAIDDARNTARIYIAMGNQIQLSQNEISAQGMIHITKANQDEEDYANRPFADLANKLKF